MSLASQKYLLKTFFGQSLNTKRAYENLRKTLTKKGHINLTECLLDYPLFKEHDGMTALDLSKEQVPNADPTAIQLIDFTGNLQQDDALNH